MKNIENTVRFIALFCRGVQLNASEHVNEIVVTRQNRIFSGLIQKWTPHTIVHGGAFRAIPVSHDACSFLTRTPL
jgi:hypothetical protein